MFCQRIDYCLFFTYYSYVLQK
uniref:Uncharacterized protein n=1 Tax=Rhizophora mucronata TaxID=61149 RepID=A0A2P2KFM7_RHIMU